jgi:hypothetical protein
LSGRRLQHRFALARLDLTVSSSNGRQRYKLQRQYGLRLEPEFDEVVDLCWREGRAA